MGLARGLVVAVGLAAACGPGTDYIDVGVEPKLPAHDDRAQAELQSIRVEVWPIARGICEELATWARSSPCGGGCASPPGFDEGASQSQTLHKTAGGAWEPVELSPDADVVDVVLRGVGQDPTPFLHGCGRVDFTRDEGTLPMPLSRAWCAEDACAPCERLECDQMPAPPDAPGDPICSQLCGEDEDCCEGECVNLDRDRAHCGSCGNACTGGLYCAQGTCDFQCVLLCGINSGCGESCPVGDWCTQESECRCGDGSACRGEEGCCDGECTAVSRDPRNCGRCRVVCDEGQTCVAGVCT